MWKFRNSLLAALAGRLTRLASVFAETAAEKPSVDVRRVGAHIGCQCGCTDTVATCAMLECSFSKPAKEKIAKMQAAGCDRQSDHRSVRQRTTGRRSIAAIPTPSAG